MGVRVKKGNTRYYVNGTKILAQDNGTKMLFHYGADGVSGFTYCLSYNVVQNYFYRKNAQGDITGIYDTNNTLLCEYIYDAWGNHKIVVDETNANAVFIANLNPFRYRGYYFDTETGLYYLNSRYYDPELGRFINADDISNIDTENFNGLNLYAYCGNDPVQNIDPNGQLFLSFLVGLLIASVTVAVVNTGVQLVSDVIDYAATGKWNSGWEDYVGAFIGGLAGGATFFLTGGNLAATFGIMNGVETLSTNLLTNLTGRTNYSIGEIITRATVSIGIGTISGWLFGGTKVAGVTIGKNNSLAIWKSGLTKLKKDIVTKMSFGVKLKGFLGFAMLKSGGALASGLFSGIYNWIREILFGEKWRVNYV